MGEEGEALVDAIVGENVVGEGEEETLERSEAFDGPADHEES